jgi:hypothetical protein
MSEDHITTLRVAGPCSVCREPLNVGPHNKIAHVLQLRLYCDACCPECNQEIECRKPYTPPKRRASAN